MAARKKTGTRRVTAARRGARARARTGRQAALPPSLKEFSRKVRGDLTRLEKQIETASRDAVRHCAHVLRNVSQLLGRLEAAGETEWLRSNEARLEAVRALRELEGTIQPPKGKRPARKTTRPRKATGAADDRRTRSVTSGRGGTRGSTRRRH